jgi:hypothetical protein
MGGGTRSSSSRKALSSTSKVGAKNRIAQGGLIGGGLGAIGIARINTQPPSRKGSASAAIAVSARPKARVIRAAVRSVVRRAGRHRQAAERDVSAGDGQAPARSVCGAAAAAGERRGPRALPQSSRDARMKPLDGVAPTGFYLPAVSLRFLDTDSILVDSNSASFFLFSASLRVR